MTDEELIARLREIQGQAGLFASAAADRIEALVKDKRWIMEERDRTFARMLTRAEKAEAEVEKLRGALTNLPAVYAHQINTGVREVYDPLQRFYTMESVLTALKGTDHEGH